MRNAVQAMAGKGTLTLRTRIESGYHLEHVGPERARLVRVDVEDTGPGHSRRGPAAPVHAVLHAPQPRARARAGGRAALDGAPGRPDPGHEPRRHGYTHACRAAAAEAGMTRILVADDEPSIRFVLREALSEARATRWSRPPTATRRASALARAALRPGAARHPHARPVGARAARRAARARRTTRPLVVIMTAQNTFENAVEAMKRGAFDYLTKPFDLRQVEALVEKARQLRSLRGEVAELRRQVGDVVPHRRGAGRPARPRCSTCSRRSAASPRATRRC